mgnify:CR=1 FL=1
MLLTHRNKRMRLLVPFDHSIILQTSSQNICFICPAAPLANPIPPKAKEKDDELDIENLDVDNNEDNLEDDTVLLEDETEIDPAADAGIVTPDQGEEEY